jgi:hypothetical protein
MPGVDGGLYSDVGFGIGGNRRLPNRRMWPLAALVFLDERPLGLHSNNACGDKVA